MKNIIDPKTDYLYSDVNGDCIRVVGSYYDLDVVKQIMISKLLNPQDTKTVPIDDFLAPIDFDKYPKLKGKKIYMYEFLSN